MAKRRARLTQYERYKSASQKLGKRIVTLREQRSWSQRTFADRCEMDPASMSRIELGHSNLTLSKALLLAEHLEISVSMLFKGVV